MLDNPILQVVTGLAFLYLVYSLLATIIKEFIASLFSYRPRMLEIGIQQMLDGHHISYYWWDYFINVLLWLAGWVRWSMAWTCRDIGTLRKRNRNRRKRILHSPGKMRTFLTTEPIVTGLRHPYWRSKLNKKAKMFATKVTTHALYKRSGEVNWIKRKKPAYLPAETFSDILIDVLGSRAKQGGGNRLILMKDISTYIHAHFGDNPELRKILDIYAEQANGDVTKFKSLLNNWFDDTMDRVSGWYKKQTNGILLFLGFCLALAFNVDTISIVKKLSTDQTARKALVQSAAHYIDTKSSRDIDAIKMPGDTGNIQKQIADIQAIYRSSIDSVNNLLGLGWDNQPLPENSASFWQYWKGKLPPAVFTPIYKSWTNPIFFLGFIRTALAISLGAPFWFDLLNKLVSLRAAGTKPEKSAAATSKTGIITQKPDPTAKG